MTSELDDLTYEKKSHDHERAEHELDARSAAFEIERLYLRISRAKELAAWHAERSRKVGMKIAAILERKDQP